MRFKTLAPLVLAFEEEDRGEAPKDLGEGTESSAGGRGTESPAIGEQLMEMRFQLLRQRSKSES